MTYEKTEWVDHIVDPETGDVIQEGTRVTAARMNHIEQGIFENETKAVYIDSEYPTETFANQIFYKKI